MKRLIIAVAVVAALGSSAFSREFPKGAAMHPPHHEVMPNQDYYAGVDMPRHHTTYPGGHGR
jgi:hypothetical protein